MNRSWNARIHLLILRNSENGLTSKAEVMSADVSLQNVHHTSPLNVCHSFTLARHFVI
jgi:hypothetical protein